MEDMSHEKKMEIFTSTQEAIRLIQILKKMDSNLKLMKACSWMGAGIFGLILANILFGLTDQSHNWVAIAAQLIVLLMSHIISKDTTNLKLEADQIMEARKGRGK